MALFQAGRYFACCLGPVRAEQDFQSVGPRSAHGMRLAVVLSLQGAVSGLLTARLWEEMVICLYLFAGVALSSLK